MNLVKYADGRGQMNLFTNVFESYFNSGFFSEQMICVDVRKKEEARMARRQIKIK